VTSEGGHASLAGTSESQDRLIAILRRRFGRASAERVLSGPGLVNLHQAVCELEGCDSPRRTPSEVTEAAFDGSSPVCRTTMDAFSAFLGAVAGDVALTFGAIGIPRTVCVQGQDAFLPRTYPDVRHSPPQPRFRGVDEPGASGLQRPRR